jgi:hypothetical protein
MINMAIAQDRGPHRVKAVLVSQESSLHTSVSNQNVYLLRIVPRSGAAFDALQLIATHLMLKRCR